MTALRRCARFAIGQLLFVACAALLLAGSPALADGPPAKLTALGRLCEQVRPAFVFIGGGSGVVISPDGLMLTNAHVIGKIKQFDVRLGDGRHFKARLLGKDVPGDLAVLQLENKPGEKLPHLKLGDTNTVRLGDRVVAIGNPIGKGFMDLEPTFTTGVVSGVDLLHGTYPDALVTDAPVNPGNSGGPLVNMQGQLVGVVGQLSNRWGLRSNTGLGFAISARRIAVWLPRLKESDGKEVRHGAIRGLEFEQLEDGTSMNQPRVAAVDEDSHAAKCGFQKGDVITSVDGIPVTTRQRLRGLLDVYPEGHELPFEVERDGKVETLKAKLVAAWKGLGVVLAKPGNADKFVRISKVEDGSPAAKAGMQKDDEIVAVGDTRIKAPVANQFLWLTFRFRQRFYIGDVLELTVRRKNDKGEFTEHELSLVAK